MWQPEASMEAVAVHHRWTSMPFQGGISQPKCSARLRADVCIACFKCGDISLNLHILRTAVDVISMPVKPSAHSSFVALQELRLRTLTSLLPTCCSSSLLTRYVTSPRRVYCLKVQFALYSRCTTCWQADGRLVVAGYLHQCNHPHHGECVCHSPVLRQRYGSKIRCAHGICEQS